MLEEKTVDIIASCVCRDCFTFGKSYENTNTIKINDYFQRITPLNLYSNKVDSLQAINADDLVFGSKFERKCIVSTFRKNMFEYPFKSEYLIIDMCQITYPIYESSIVKNSYILHRTWFNKNLEAILKFHRDPFVFVDFKDIPKDFVYRCIDLFFEDIKKRYDESKIICCEVYNATEFYNSTTKKFQKFGEGSALLERNEYLREIYNYTQKKLKKAFFIPTPSNAFGDDKHIWGLGTMHFVKEYYVYLKSAIDIAISSKDIGLKQLAVKMLNDNCEKIFEMLRQSLTNNVLYQDVEKTNQNLQNTIKSLTLENQNLNNKIKLYEGAKIAKQKEVEKLKSDLNLQIKDNNLLKKSTAYKLGNVIAYVPKKIKKLVRRGKK